MTTQRLTTAQAIVKYLAALRVEMADGSIQPYCAGVCSTTIPGRWRCFSAASDLIRLRNGRYAEACIG